MKRSTKLIVALLVVVAALAVIYRLMHRVPSADLEANVQMQQIITDAGCLRCHTSTPELPFYANMPVAGKIVMEDVSKAYRAFDMTQMEKDMKEGRPLNPVDLAKVEKVILDGKMPQAKYYLVHWGASFNDAKKEAIKECALALRPWRKGPFELFGTFIDTEWQSFTESFRCYCVNIGTNPPPPPHH